MSKLMKSKPGRLFALLLPLIFLCIPVSSQVVNHEVAKNPLQTDAPEQPIPYSHKKHLAMGLQCQMCHTAPAPGNQMTFPATATCMTCHAAVAANKPAIQKLIGFSKSGHPIPWVRVYKVLPGINWTHRKHLEAGARCETCHGEMAQMDRISEVTSVTTMYVCLNCHQKNNAKTTCDTCHAWPKAAVSQ